MQRKLGRAFFTGWCMFLIFGCGKEPNEINKGFQPPAHFPNPIYNFENNPFSEAGFELGRRLFFDPILSKDSSISCGSCHHQQYAFSDFPKVLSTGVNGEIGLRNSPALFNLAWSPAFMYDGGINHLEVMPIAPITDFLEMNESLTRVLEKLNQHPEYPTLFKTVFNRDEINDRLFLLALAQFMGGMISANSRYDDFVTGKKKFTSDEFSGYQLFKQHCSACHAEPLMTDFSYRNNGLAIHSNDPGRMRITALREDSAKFKVPSLRNIELTAPYLHDGSLSSLDEALERYAQPAVSENLDALLVNGIQLSKTEKEQLLTFLKTLTDFTFISDERFSKPPVY